jgi:hypothetical protein
LEKTKERKKNKLEKHSLPLPKKKVPGSQNTLLSATYLYDRRIVTTAFQIVIS